MSLKVDDLVNNENGSENENENEWRDVKDEKEDSIKFRTTYLGYGEKVQKKHYERTEKIK